MQKRLALALLFLLLPCLAADGVRAADPVAEDVLRDMKRVADWQIAHPSKHRITDWTHGPYFLGLFNLHQVSGEEPYLDALEAFGARAKWGPGPRVTHADDHAVLQAWLEMCRGNGDPSAPPTDGGPLPADRSEAGRTLAGIGERRHVHVVLVRRALHVSARVGASLRTDRGPALPRVGGPGVVDLYRRPLRSRRLPLLPRQQVLPA